MNIWVRDKDGGKIHQVGTDIHDSLIFIDGKVEYCNLQNGGGTLGGYEFVETPDLDDYVVVTPIFRKADTRWPFCVQQKK